MTRLDKIILVGAIGILLAWLISGAHDFYQAGYERGLKEGQVYQASVEMMKERTKQLEIINKNPEKHLLVHWWGYEELLFPQQYKSEELPYRERK